MGKSDQSEEVDLMGYTHYWRRQRTIPQNVFLAILRDFQTIKPNLGVKISDESCSGAIIFNGMGDDEYETFVFEREFEPRSWQTPDSLGRYYNFCKTARRNYDLAVQVALIIIKYHLPEVLVSSDGDLPDWTKAIWLCHDILGYGERFELDDSCE